MPLYMDVRNNVDGLTTEAAAAAHKADLSMQAKHGVDYKQYWFDIDTGRIFCHVEAPNKEAAEAVGAVPRGTHHWDDFVTPEELTDLLADAGLTVTQTQGIAWRPGKGLHLSDDMSLNYILAARRA